MAVLVLLHQLSIRQYRYAVAEETHKRRYGEENKIENKKIKWRLEKENEKKKLRKMKRKEQKERLHQESNTKATTNQR